MGGTPQTFMRLSADRFPGPAVPVCQRWARGAGPLLEEGPEEVVVGDFGRQRLVVILQDVEELLLGEVDAVLPQDLRGEELPLVPEPFKAKTREAGCQEGAGPLPTSPPTPSLDSPPPESCLPPPPSTPPTRQPCLATQVSRGWSTWRTRKMDRAEGTGGETGHGALTMREASGCSFKGGEEDRPARAGCRQ